MKFLEVLENSDFEVFGVSLGPEDISFGVFGAQLRKSNDSLHGAKHSPPSLMTGGPEGRNSRFPEKL